MFKSVNMKDWNDNAMLSFGAHWHFSVKMPSKIVLVVRYRHGNQTTAEVSYKQQRLHSIIAILRPCETFSRITMRRKVRRASHPASVAAAVVAWMNDETKMSRSRAGPPPSHGNPSQPRYRDACDFSRRHKTHRTSQYRCIILLRHFIRVSDESRIKLVIFRVTK